MAFCARGPKLDFPDMTSNLYFDLIPFHIALINWPLKGLYYFKYSLLPTTDPSINR